MTGSASDWARRGLAALAWIAASAAVLGLVGLAAWVPPEALRLRLPYAYGAAVVGLILSAFYVLGTDGAARERWLGAFVLLRTTAIACAALRQPDHAWAAALLAAPTCAAALAAAELARGRSASFARLIHALALLTLAGVPPLPGFFAAVDTTSALIHARLAWLAAVSALGGVAVVYAVVRTLIPAAQAASDTSDAPADLPAPPGA